MEQSKELKIEISDLSENILILKEATKEDELEVNACWVQCGCNAKG